MDYTAIINQIGYHPLNDVMDRHEALQFGLDQGYSIGTLIQAITEYQVTYQNYPDVVNQIQNDINWLQGIPSM